MAQPEQMGNVARQTTPMTQRSSGERDAVVLGEHSCVSKRRLSFAAPRRSTGTWVLQSGAGCAKSAQQPRETGGLAARRERASACQGVKRSVATKKTLGIGTHPAIKRRGGWCVRRHGACSRGAGH